MNFFDLSEYLVMVAWFKNLSVTAVRTARMKGTVFAYAKMGGNMQQNVDGCNHDEELLQY